MNSNTKNLALSAMFIAIGLFLPFLILQIPQIGMMLLPMHIPVLLCGLICGKKYGFIVGFILPLLRGFLFGMPALFPMGAAMAFELATYGFVIGFLYHHVFRDQSSNSIIIPNLIALFGSLIIAMIAGRIVWGVAMAIFVNINGGAFTWQWFIGGALLSAIPGIVLQLVLIPIIMLALTRSGIIRRPASD